MPLLVPDYIAERETKENLRRHFNEKMENVINANKDKDSFYILGKVKFLPEYGGKVGRVFLDASDTKPPVVKGTFVYFVDNKAGTKELLWTCDNNELNLVPLNKKHLVTPT